ncbi:hypothetical protein CONPUDRAFT_146187 [Coniophora puteana RWD-64-598 SS2]|uniref:Carboxymuconolactone decarboxylase-like domain-containing protein n=1 Tax=Coniophora puteana (strain RWD-64-598) TaxID=741705 RepID=A0A5M3MDB5_CONPW|nr:uncharacterized protein CONPUDRAFT_146187 [Coniophora puteana RWD-64-598 SS2]EIW77103.1 hypothetical protein CONPUDRAFT_146187 [Coniophora puteana RWD-64-598 SS2]
MTSVPVPDLGPGPGPGSGPSESTRIPPIHPSNPPRHLTGNQPFTDALASAVARRISESQKPTSASTGASTSTTPSASLLALDQALLYSPALTRGWNAFFSALRTGCTAAVGDDLRELIMCRVAALNRARFMWAQHRALLARAWAARLGAGAEAEAEEKEKASGVLALLQHAPPHAFAPPSAPDPTSEPQTAQQNWRAEGAQLGMDERVLAVLAYTDAMTRDVSVSDAVWAQLKTAFTDEGDGLEQVLVEMTGIIAGYNCGSRFLVALDVGGMKDWDNANE